MDFLIPLIILIYSAIIHEVMHGWVAEKLGDPTAKVMGRLTLNPLPHIDPIMSIALPALLILSGSPIVFGAAKPVPVNPMYFRDGRKDLALTALAGPFINLVLAITGALIIRTELLPHFLNLIFYQVVFYNLILGILNLIPIPPLDGSKVFSILLPKELALSYMSIGQVGIFILFILLLFPIGPFSLGNIINELMLLAIRILGI